MGARSVRKGRDAKGGRPRVVVDPEFRNLIPPLQKHEFAELEQCVLREGIRDALVTWNNVLLDGHHRHEIALRHGLAFRTVEVQLADRSEACAWIVSNQLSRRNLSSFQRVELALKLERIERSMAKERQRSHSGTAPGRGRALPPMLAEVSGEVRDRLAKAAGVSHGTFEKAKAVLAQAPASALEELRRGEATIHQVYTDIRKADREARRDALFEENRRLVAQVQELPRGAQFRTFVIDPPWSWDGTGDDELARKFGLPYPTMAHEEIARLPIPELAAQSAHLYLWTTNHALPQAFALLDAWGFHFAAILTWAKPAMGFGAYFRNSTEHVLFAVKGSLPLARRDVGTWFRWPYPGAHSQKPEEFFSLVESCSPGPRIELFARRPRPGWVTWGAECRAADGAE